MATELRRGGLTEKAPDDDDRASSAPSFFSLNQDNKGKKDLLLGKFQVLRLLGRGSFAKVYAACNIADGNVVAIKALDKAMVAMRGVNDRIEREITALRRVRHPNIVHLHEVMATKSMVYYVMEYVPGGELFSRVKRGLVPEDMARSFFQQLISAMACCHNRGVFHRDLKPANLLLDGNGNIKVADFGFSALSEQTRGELFRTVCGTPIYMAPEVIQGKVYNGAMADIWSSGIILYQLMSGVPPFTGHNIQTLGAKIKKGKFKCLPWFSPELVNFLHRLLVADPKERITIPEIMEDPWFKKGFEHVRYYVEDDELYPVIDSLPRSENGDSGTSVVAAATPAGLRRPRSLNAFDIISSSKEFDLSRLFDQDTVERKRLVSTKPVRKILDRLEEIAKMWRYKVFKKDNGQVNLVGRREGKKGPLTVSMEIAEITPGMVIMEVSKKSGDKEHFDEFYRKGLKPGLRNLMLESSPISLSPSPAYLLGRN